MDDAAKHTPELASTADRRSGMATTIEDGILAGITGGLVVAVWFLVLDTARGQIFLTPTLIGSVLFLGKPPAEVIAPNGLVVFAYTGFHGVAFLGAGVALAWIVNQFERNPQFGMVLLMLFLLFESVLFSFEAAIFPNLVGVMGTMAVASANLFAAVAMFWFLLRRHPSAVAQLRNAWHDE